jgi:MFS transporter, DHA1 family, tetracycline resistance protein
VVGVMSAVVQGGLVKRIVGRFGERRTVLIGLVFSVAGYVALGLANRAWLLYVMLVPFALGGLSEPATKALLTREVAANEQGELQGSLGSLMSVTSIVGPLLGTGLLARFAPEGSSPHVPGVAFFAAAALNALGFLFAARLFASRRENAPTPR